jgi:type VI secretion system protein ImpF
MARSSSEINTAVTLSVLDRLIDSEPGNSSEAGPTRAHSVRQLKEALRRDLEWLLNSRRIVVAPDESLKETNRSLYVYGLPDFASYSIKSPQDKAKLVRSIHSAVKQFESRLANVRVLQLEESGSGTRSLHFRIEGLLLMDPAPEHISFDTVLELTSGEYEVSDAG